MLAVQHSCALACYPSPSTVLELGMSQTGKGVLNYFTFLVVAWCF